MKIRRRHVLKIALATAAVFAASINCAERKDLRKFSDCQEFETFLKDQALHPVNEQQPPNSGMTFLLGCASENFVELGAASENTSAPNDRDYTTTNVQEQAVDEPDFVKNDGDYILVLRRGHLVILDAWPADQTHIVSDIVVDRPETGIARDATPFAMFFDGARLLFISGSGQDWRNRSAPFGANSAAGMVRLALYNVTDRANPQLLRRVRISGNYVDARRVGDEVLVVTTAQMNWPATSSTLFSDDKNRAVLDQVSLDQVLPSLDDQVMATDTAPRRSRACSCDNAYAPTRTDGTNLVLIHALSMADAAAPIQSTTVVTRLAQLYSSAHNLYLATTRWLDGGFFTPNYAETRVFKFAAFNGTGMAEYAATGVIEGEILNQFAMDENGNDFRVVVSTQEEGQTNSLLVLEQQAEALVEVARVDDIGRNEFVQSVRYIDKRAYIVTYPERTFTQRVPPRPPGGMHDPLWVVDLSERLDPRLRGRLEVGGYSTYIHPLDERHLLTIGVDTDENNVILGLSLSIFDVTNPDQPALDWREDFGRDSSWSEALQNHHAFTYFPQQHALAIPLQVGQPTTGAAAWQLTSTGLEVYRVDAERGFTHLGHIEQTGLFSQFEVNWQNVQCIDVRRSVMIADASDAYVYAISAGGVSVARIAEDLPAVAAVPLWAPNDALCPDIIVPL